MRAMIVFGTRPEAIKLAPLVLELKRRAGIEVTVCNTAQHRQMLDPVLEWFRIVPDYDLNLMQPNQTLARFHAQVLERTSQVFEEARPDIVLVQGDTTTAFVSATAAFYQRIRVGHVEAGLRTGDIYNPFPEEANRRLLTIVANYHFAPTKQAYDTLLREGIAPERVYLTGNTVIDALKWTVAQPHALNLDVPLNDPAVRLILVTAHRRESFGQELEQICNALLHLVTHNPDVQLVFPVHLNPNVQEFVHRILGGNPRIHLINPLSYPDLVHLMARVYLVMTDSGGLQEEAPALGKPVLVMRRTTERPEAVEAGTAQLVGTNTQAIIDAAQALLDNPERYQAMARGVSPFGDGTASRQIADVLASLSKA